MNKRLKDFLGNQEIPDHFEKEMNVDEPSEMLWLNIEKQLGGKEMVRKKSFSHWDLLKVASVVLLFGIGIGYWFSLQKNNVEVENQMAFEKDFPEIQKAENYYLNFVNNQKVILENDESNLGKTVLEELNELDSIYLGLKETLLQNPENQQVKNAIYNNLIIRKEILEEQINLLKQTNQKQKENENKSI